jgi:hypothetical protein
MRFAALCLALVACSSDPSPAAVADASPSDVVLDVAPDVAVADVASDVAADVAQVDAIEPDVAVADVTRDAPRDVAPEADPCGASSLRTCDINGHDECVNIERGRVLGGVVVHCGACGVTCAAGEVCAELRCQRL